jgi:hypothetical protein
MFEREAPPATASDVLDSPDAVVAELARVQPIPEDAVTLSLLDPAALSAAGRVDLLVASERQAAWVAAQQQRVLARMAVGQSDDRGWVREDLACALRLSGMAARRLAVAQTLTEQLPATLRLLDRGRVGYLHAAFLADAVFALNDKQARAVEERVLPRAPEQTLSEFQRSVRRAVARVAAATVEEQRVEAMTQRRVCITPRDDGMTELWALLPAEGAAAIMTAVDALASVTSADDPRTPDQRRAPTPWSTSVSPRCTTRYCPKHKGCGPRSRSRSPCPRCSAPMSSPANSPATDPSPPPWRGDSPPMSPARGGGCHRPRVGATARLRPRHPPPTQRPRRLRHRPRPDLHPPRM